MSPVHIADYDQIVAAINKKYEGSLHRGNEQIRLPSISTGSPELDIAMGGGVPQGRFTRYYGSYGSTKTMTALTTIAEAQRMGLYCALYNVEKRYEQTFAERLGVRTSELTVVEGTTIEEIADKMESLLGVVHLHVIDSCSIAVSEDELTCDIRDWRPGISARAWGKAFRRINERWDLTDNTAILIDQMTANFRTGGEDPKGGRVFDHQSSMSVLFKTGSWMWRTDEGSFSDKGQKTGVDKQISPDGREIKIRVEKSSVCRPFRTATLHMDLDSLKYDRAYEYIKLAKFYGAIRQTGGGNYYYPMGKGNEKHFRGEPALREFIDKNPLARKRIRKIALEAALR